MGYIKIIITVFWENVNNNVFATLQHKVFCPYTDIIEIQMFVYKNYEFMPNIEKPIVSHIVNHHKCNIN